MLIEVVFFCLLCLFSCQFIDTAAAPSVFKCTNDWVFMYYMCQYSCRLLFYFYDCDSLISLLTRPWRKYKIKSYQSCMLLNETTSATICMGHSVGVIVSENRPTAVNQ